MTKRIAVVAASGIGDALILHIASHNFSLSGWEVTTFSDHLPSFGSWLQGYTFAPQPPLDDLEEIFLGKFDAVFLQHDNSEKAKKIALLSLPVYIFYGSYVPIKHLPWREKYDYICNKEKTMVANLVQAVGRIIGACSSENGLKAPPLLTYRKYPKRIAIHPTSTKEEKNWPREKFIALFEQLQKRGYEPVFTVGPKEREAWNNAPLFPHLEAVTSFLYESGGFIGNDSGLGHIASCLRLPYLVIGPSLEHLQLWQPGWRRGVIVAAPNWSSYWKWTRQKWRDWISVRSVYKNFIQELEKNNQYLIK
ncbi:MAG: hypothetical protein HY069_00135 [Chlamydiia bacterium]|nr:hypothetical protein [Chlamydiia bacterium]